MSFARSDHKAPAYLAINPEGKIPTLLVDGRPLTEVAGILFYLAKRFPDANLLPKDDVEAQAHAVSWMSFVAATIHPARQRGAEQTREVLGIADRRLNGRRGFSTATRSPTFICSGCIGGSATGSNRHRPTFQIFPLTMTA